MRWAVPIVAFAGASGCDRMFGLDRPPPGNSIDAAVDAAIDGPIANVDDHRHPYVCDADTIALYHFDTDQLVDACSQVALINVNAAPTTGPTLEFGNARTFGATAHARTPSTNVVTLTDAFTIDVWVRPTTFVSAGAYRTLVAVNNGQAGGRQFYVALDDAGHVRITKGTASCTTITPNFGVQSTATLVVDRWQHVRAGWDGVGFRISVDGATADQIAEPTSNVELCASASEELHIGAMGGTAAAPTLPNQNFIGDLDELRVSRVSRF